MDFTNAVKLFEEKLQEEGRSPRTIEAYVGGVNRILRPIARDWHSPAKAARFLKTWRTQLQRSTNAGKISDAKVRLDVACVRKFYSTAVDAAWCKRNPATQLSSLKRKERLPRPLPPEHLAKLMQAVATTSSSSSEAVRDRAMMELFLNGLRNSEVVGMRVSGLEWDSRQHTLVARVIGKGGSEAEIVLKPEAAAFVSWYLLLRFAPATWRAKVEALGQLEVSERLMLTLHDVLEQLPIEQKVEHVFLWKDRPFRRQEVNRMFHKYRKAAGLPKTYGPHSLRHTCGTEMLRRGADLRAVQEVLRHKHITQTQLYTKVERDTKSNAARLLPNFGGLDTT